MPSGPLAWVRGSMRDAAAALALPIVIALLAATLALLAGVDGRWHAALDYRRSAIAAGEVWRLFAAHLMHWSTAHAVLDIAGLLSVAWIFGRELKPIAQMLVVACGAACVDAGLWWWHPEVDRYVGLSGVAHAWFAAGAMCWLMTIDEPRAKRRAWGSLLLVGLVIKLLLEQRHQAFWLNEAGFPVVSAAHRWGAAGGALCGVALTLDRSRVRQAPASAASRGR